jgi:hypothetical protein
MWTEFEPIIAITTWWDGPRGGITHFRGRPHLFGSSLLDASPEALSVFVLTPVPEPAVPILLELEEIGGRFDAARAEGRAPADCYQVLPQDRPRYDALLSLLIPYEITEAAALTARGEFRVRRRSESGGALEWAARWELVTDATHDAGRLRPFRPAVLYDRPRD